MRALHLVMLAGCGAPPPPCAGEVDRARDGGGGNILVVLLDDVGIDRIAAYDSHPRPARTPNLDTLASRGTRFTQAYAEPVCGPARAALLTGRMPRTNGVGANPDGGRLRPGLALDEVTLPEVLVDSPYGPYASAAFGKWHLSSPALGNADHPNLQGFDHFDGHLAPPLVHAIELEQPVGYYHWQHVVDGEVSASDEYLTTATADALVDAVALLPEPWFVYYAPSAIHAPYELPPRELYEGTVGESDFEVANAMFEALDHELGRVLAAVGEDVTVLVTADNGTSAEVATLPLLARRAKGTVYSGGTQVPLWVAGPGVQSGTSDSLVHITDLFATVLELAGLGPGDVGRPIDGVSLLGELFDGTASPRRCLFVETFGPKPLNQAVRDSRYTLVQHSDGPEELYLRAEDPLESNDLTVGGKRTRADAVAQRALRAQLRAGR